MIHYLYLALDEPIGLIVRADDANLLRQKLYAERKKDPKLRSLSILASPEKPDELWIVKKRETNGR